MTIESNFPTKPGYYSFGLSDSEVKFRPLWPVETAAIWLRTNTKGIEKRMQDGRIAWAFDISAGSRRVREIRLLAYSVLECAGSQIESLMPTKNLPFQKVADLILGNQRATVRGIELQRIFLVSPRLIENLRKTNDVPAIGIPSTRYGINASPQFARSAVIEFLKRRRIV